MPSAMPAAWSRDLVNCKRNARGEGRRCYAVWWWCRPQITFWFCSSMMRPIQPQGVRMDRVMFWGLIDGVLLRWLRDVFLKILIRNAKKTLKRLVRPQNGLRSPIGATDIIAVGFNPRINAKHTTPPVDDVNWNTENGTPAIGSCGFWDVIF